MAHKTHIALFAGMGGFIFPTEDLGYKTVLANDNDKNCIKTLAASFPKIPLKKCSINELNFKEMDLPEELDLLTAGFPCQSFSNAGDNKGFDDPRGQLFFEIIRLCKELKKMPKIMLLENVPNLKVFNKGERLAIILKELRLLGYWVNQNNAIILNSNQFTGTPQNRDRLYIVAFHSSYFNKNKFNINLFNEKVKKSLWSIIDRTKKKPENLYLNSENKYYKMLKEAIDSHGSDRLFQIRRVEARAIKVGNCPTLTANMGGGGHNVPFLLDDYGIRKLSIFECLTLQGFIENKIDFVDISDSAKLSMIGNSVDPKMIKMILKNIVE